MKAALRDASWYSNPDVTSPKKYHIVNNVEGHPNCGLQAILSEESVIDAGDVPENSRCMRNGCRQHWPEEEK
jgi:hypothetical protein